MAKPSIAKESKVFEQFFLAVTLTSSFLSIFGEVFTDGILRGLTTR